MIREMKIVMVVIVAAVLLGPERAALADPSPDAAAKPAAGQTAPKAATGQTGAATNTNATASQEVATHVERYTAFHQFASALGTFCATSPASLVTTTTASSSTRAAINTAISKVKSASTPDVNKAATQLQTLICPALCAAETSTAFNACAFTGAAMANAAVASDWPDASALMAAVATQAAAMLGPDQAAAVEGMEASLNSASPLGSLLASVATIHLQGVGGTELAGFASQVLTTGLEALAKLIADRAQREVVEYFLAEMRAAICTVAAGDTDPTRPELSTYWFPATCALTAQASPTQYGTGSAQLNALRAALVKDVRSWPGELAGLGLGAAFWGTTNPNLFSCDANPLSTNKCKSLTTLRAATATRINGWLEGQSGTAALYGLGSDIDVANRYRPALAQPTYAFYSAPIEVLGCVAAIPQIAENYHTAFDSTQAGALVSAEAIVLTTMVTAPACWPVFGQGIETDRCGWFAPGEDVSVCQASHLGRDASAGIERLSTLVRLGQKALSTASTIQTDVVALSGAITAYQSAVNDMGSSLQSLKDVKPPTLSLTNGAGASDSGIAAAQAYVRTSAHLITLGGTQRVVLSALAVAEAGIALARSATDAIVPLTDPALVPGLASSDPITTTVQNAIASAKTILDDLHDTVGVVRDVTAEDWAAALTDAAGTGTRLLAQSCPTGRCSASVETTIRYSAVLAAILSSTDANQLAAVLDEAATPPGGWRDKGIDGRTTVAITAEPGFFGGVELRHGAYGVIYNNFETAYAQPPALTLPLGFEFAWGNGKKGLNPISLFVPILDPAAFLQYDVSQNGRLPGAQLLTALSPGIGLRVGIGGSPFGIMPLVVYRPGFRAWDSSLADGGADALQFGLNVDVDVTLFDLSVGGGK